MQKSISMYLIKDVNYENIFDNVSNDANLMLQLFFFFFIILVKINTAWLRTNLNTLYSMRATEAENGKWQ